MHFDPRAHHVHTHSQYGCTSRSLATVSDCSDLNFMETAKLALKCQLILGSQGMRAYQSYFKRNTGPGCWLLGPFRTATDALKRFPTCIGAAAWLVIITLGASYVRTAPPSLTRVFAPRWYFYL